MDIQEIIDKNFSATIKRGQITPSTTDYDFLIKIHEEIDELEQSIKIGKFDEKELADIVLVCFSMARHKGIDLLKVMEEKVLFNEKRKD